MNRILLMLLFVVSVSIGLMAQPGTTMYTNGRHLYSAVGEKVVLRGVNEMFIYSPNDKQGINILPQIAQTGANSVRLVWLSWGSSVDLDSLITNCIRNKMIPMVDLHDATGNWGNVQTCLNYWKRSDVVAVMQKHKKWVLLNIANEAGDASVTNEQFRTVYLDAVAQLRGVGYTMPIIIDAADWGKNENNILTTWSDIVQADPQHNCLFSLHPYWVDAPAPMQTRFTNLFNAIVANNIPFLIGEGPQQVGWNCSSQVPYQWVIQQCQTLGIGWLVWSWGTLQNGDCQGGRSFDITTNGIYGNWANDWGRLVAIDDPNSIKNTSIRPPSILGNVPPDTQAPSTPTNLVVSNVSSLSASLSWTASTDNVGVTGYDIYNGNVLLGSSVNNYANLNGLICNTVYNFSVKAKDAAGNASTASNTATATTGICDTQAPTAPTNLVASGVSPTSVQLSWTAATDNVGVTAYQVFSGGTLLNTTVATSLSVTNLTCNTPYAFSVKAVDAAANASVSSNTANVTTGACPSGEVVYADNLNANWEDWSWSAYRNFANTSNPTAAEGTNSIRVDYGGYAGFSLRRNATLTPSANTVIKLMVYSNGANSLDIHTQADDGGGYSNSVIVTTTPNQWQEITVTMAALGNPSAIKRINVKNNSGNSPTVFIDYVRFDNGTADTQAPTAPTNLAVSNLGQSSLTLSWTAATDNVGVTAYQVYQGSTLLNGNVTGTAFSVTGLNCNTPYSFVITAKDAAGNTSSGSNTASVTTLACDTQAPTAPSNLTVSNVTATGLVLNWTASTDNVGVTAYRVLQGSTVLADNVSGTSYTVSNLSCNTSYDFSVVAKDAAGNLSTASNTAPATTLTCPSADIVYDDALNSDWQNWSWGGTYNLSNTSPVQEGVNSMRADYGSYGGLSLRKNVAISPTTNLLLKFWVFSNGTNSLLLYTQNEDSGSSSSSVYFNTTPNQWQEITIDMNALGNPNAIKRINIQNNSSNSVTVFFDQIRFATGTAPDTQAPTSPTNLAASGISQNSLTLNWTASNDNVGVVSYQVYQNGSLLNGNVTGTSLGVSGLTCGTQYNFSVTAKDAAGNTSPVSNVVTPTTLSCPDTQAPTSPTNLAASGISQNSLTLNWTASNDNVGVVSYQVYQNGSLLNGNVTGTSLGVSGLTCGTQYNFSVTAKDAAGNTSPVSNVITPTTSTCAATTVVIYDETLNSDWNDWSWATTRNFNNTSPVRVGSKSARVDYTAWGALSLRKISTTVTTTTSTAVRFWIRTPVASTIKVYTSSTDTGGDGSGYTFTTPANQWREYIVTRSQLGNPSQIKRVHIQNYSANNVTAYVDNLRLVSVTGARLAQESAEVTGFEAFPNPSVGQVMIRYVAQKSTSVQLSVLGMDGSQLYQQQAEVQAGENTLMLDLSNRPTGLYLIRLQDDKGSSARKIAIVK